MSHPFVFSIFLIFAGAGILATLALYTRQSLLVAYMLIGIIIGPWGLRFVNNTNMINQIGTIGIIFLLFLLGLNLQPQSLLRLFRKTTIIACVSSLLFLAIGLGLGLLFGFDYRESLVIGVAITFSSTIIGLKLLPTTILHHQHTGEVMISILLMQDLIAIFALVLLNGSAYGLSWHEGIKILVGLPCLIILAFAFERFILSKLFARFDRIHEYVFLICIAWCLGLAELTNWLGLSLESGAFIAGVALAQGPIALYIAESLKPLRDFFLILFFFSVGATFNIQYLPDIFQYALILGGVVLLVKPAIFAFLLKATGEKEQVSWEVGTRLGQGSEFSLLVAYLAASPSLGIIGDQVSSLIQATTILTFVVSSYLVVWRYPTPIAISDKLRRD